VAEHLATHPEVGQVCLFALPINRIDVTGVEMFERLRSMLRERCGVLHVSGLKLPVERVLERAGALVPLPDLALYRTDAEALAALQRQGTAPD
jgi:SulP family sulfate permease